MKHLPKITMRDLLWLIVLVVLSVLLWKEHKEVTNLRRQLQSAQMREAELEAERVQLQTNLLRHPF